MCENHLPWMWMLENGACKRVKVNAHVSIVDVLPYSDFFWHASFEAALHEKWACKIDTCGSIHWRDRWTHEVEA